MTTHNLGQARRLGDEILFLDTTAARERAPRGSILRETGLRRGRGIHQRRTAMELRRTLVHRWHGRSCWQDPRRAGRSSRCPRPPRPSSPGCSGTSCRSSRRRPAWRCAWWRSAPARRSTSQARRCRRRVRACASRRGEVRCRGPWRETRRPVMYNDFVIVGPKADPAKVAGLQGRRGGVQEDQRQAPFVSRGDRSGTHMAELALWKAAGIDHRQGGRGTGRWAGHGADAQHRLRHERLRLADRATWLLSRTAASSRSSWKATSACSTSTA
jgi:hypothetical protein